MELHTEGTQTIQRAIIASHASQLRQYATVLEEVVKHTSYEIPESALRAPFDLEALQAVRTIQERFTSVRKVVLLGIGGSDMGVRAMYDALRGYHLRTSESDVPELITLGTIEPLLLTQAVAQIKKIPAKDFVLVIVSKSGTTTETIANANAFYGALSEKFGEAELQQRTIVITDDTSPLSTQARTWGCTVLPIPAPIGGRFSVFTGVGLLPLSLLGFDIEAFCSGARDAITKSIVHDSPNVGALLASILFEAYLRDARIHELFFWNPELESLGKWYRQLLAESIGKERNDGTRVGITPSIAIGSTDLHSLGQLVFGGRNDRFTTFVSAPKNWQTTLTCSSNASFSLPAIEGKTLGNIMDAMYHGVQDTYLEHRLPFITLELSAINERELGAFMGLHISMVLYLAKLFDIDAFDQPAVERYKTNVRKLLTRQ